MFDFIASIVFVPNIKLFRVSTFPMLRINAIKFCTFIINQTDIFEYNNAGMPMMLARRSKKQVNNQKT